MIKWLLIYLLSIFLFGWMYCFLWLYSPDSFVFTDQYNLHPFSSKGIDFDEYKNLQYYSKQVDSLRKKIIIKTNELNAKKKLRDSINFLQTKTRNIFEGKRRDSIEAWRKRQVPQALKDSINILTKIIKRYKENGVNDRYTLAKFGLELSKKELELATIEVESSDFILKNLLFFSDSLLLPKLITLDTVYNQLEYHVIPDLELEINKLEYDIEHMDYNLLNEYYYRINFMDFLLFSASNASTVTYGDIIPNSTLARILTFMQALICICLIAFFTDALLRKYLQPPKGVEENSLGKILMVEPQIRGQIIEKGKVSEEERRNRRRLRKYAAHGRRLLNNK